MFVWRFDRDATRELVEMRAPSEYCLFDWYSVRRLKSLVQKMFNFPLFQVLLTRHRSTYVVSLDHWF